MKRIRNNTQSKLEQLQFHFLGVEALLWALSDAIEFQNENGRKFENGMEVAIDAVANFTKMINESFDQCMEEAIHERRFAEYIKPCETSEVDSTKA